MDELKKRAVSQQLVINRYITSFNKSATRKQTLLLCEHKAIFDVGARMNWFMWTIMYVFFPFTNHFFFFARWCWVYVSGYKISRQSIPGAMILIASDGLAFWWAVERVCIYRLSVYASIWSYEAKIKICKIKTMNPFSFRTARLMII